jgi:Glutathione peroxidase
MIERQILASLSIACFLCAMPAFTQKREAKTDPKTAVSAEKPKQTVYDFSLVDQDGKVVPLSNYKGKVLLVVNLASQSLFSDQTLALNELQKAYGPRGLQVIGIPSSDFGNQELKDPAALRKYYADAIHADFPIFAVAKLTGINAIPLYEFLCDPKRSVPGGAIHWNFTKFLIDRNGAPLARYEVDTDPADVDFHVIIESALSGKFKKASGEGGGGRRSTENSGPPPGV